jgi:hypothetical protein
MSEAERLMHVLWSAETIPGTAPCRDTTRKKAWQALAAAIRALEARAALPTLGGTPVDQARLDSIIGDRDQILKERNDAWKRIGELRRQLEEAQSNTATLRRTIALVEDRIQKK